jgi:hypothetical protein
MAMPMSACFSAGASLTPSPVIATTSPLACSALHQAQLLLRIDTREDVDLLDYSAQALVVQSREIDPGERCLSFLGDVELAGDRQGGDRVIAGDHLDRDAGACVHGGCFRRAGRSPQADEDQDVGRLVEGDHAGDQNARLPISSWLQPGVERCERGQLFESALEVASLPSIACAVAMY